MATSVSFPNKLIVKILAMLEYRDLASRIQVSVSLLFSQLPLTALSSIRVPFTARVGHRQVYKHVFDLIGGSSSLDYHFELGPGDLGTERQRIVGPTKGCVQYLLGPLNVSSRPRHRLPLAVLLLPPTLKTGGQSREKSPCPCSVSCVS